MSAATLDHPTFRSPFADTKTTFPHLLVSEWRKLWSLRSTWWVLGSTVLIMIGFALAFSAAMTSLIAGDPEVQSEIAAAGGIPATTFISAGYQFAALVAAALGAISITGEYSTGMIRATLSAAPKRLPVLWAKLVVIGVVVFVVIAASTAVAYLVSDPILANHDITVDLSDADQLRSLIGVPLYVTVVALFAAAVGTLLRNTPGTIVTVVALFFLVPGIIASIASLTGARWAEVVNQWLPSSAGERVITQIGDSSITSGITVTTSEETVTALPLFDAWPGFGVLVAYTVVLIIAAAFSLRRRDA